MPCCGGVVVCGRVRGRVRGGRAPRGGHERAVPVRRAGGACLSPAAPVAALCSATLTVNFFVATHTASSSFVATAAETAAGQGAAGEAAAAGEPCARGLRWGGATLGEVQQRGAVMATFHCRWGRLE